jgi:CheY-like chemotaxis protein
MRVFISSTYSDLAAYRSRVAEAVERLGQQGVRMEVFGARPDEATTASLEEVEEADLFVGIYAHRYGHIPTGSKSSITELELDHARKLGKPIFCFVVDDDHPWPPQHVETEPGRRLVAELKESIDRRFVRESFTTPEDLAFKVAASIGRFLLKQKVKSELARAAKNEPAITDQILDQVARRAERLASIIEDARVLLVNDVPREMRHVLRILRDLSVEVDVARDTTRALHLLSMGSYDAVISDMQRDGIPDEGLRFLEAMRRRGVHRPTVFTVGRYKPERGTPAYAFGITNRVDDLLNYLFDIFERVRG